MSLIGIYDPKGNKIKEIYGNGKRYKELLYDAGDRLVSAISYAAPSNQGTPVPSYMTEYEYDVNDNVKLMKDSKYENNAYALTRYTEYSYDYLNRLSWKAELDGPNIPTSQQINAKKINYEYDIDDNVTLIDYPNTGNKVTGVKFVYNNNKWLTEVKAKLGNSEKTLRQYQYSNTGKLEKMVNYAGFTSNGNGGNVSVRKHTYDLFGRPEKIEYFDKDGGNPKLLESYEYTFDKNDNILTEKLYNNIPSVNADKVDQTKVYEYDSLDRIKKTTITGKGTQNGYNSLATYNYNNMGNLISETKDGMITTNIYNGLNQLKKSTETGPNNYQSVKDYDYDIYGNQEKEINKLGTGSIISTEIKDMKYDVDNRLIELTHTKPGVATFTQVNTYNGEGQRIRKSEGSNTTKYYYQGSSVLYTTDGANVVNSLNLMGPSENLISTARGNGNSENYYFYHNDVRESTTNLINSNLQSVVSYDYTDFGETTIKGDQNFYNEICYTGGIYDKSTGLYYLNSRFYDPDDKTFLTQDSYRGENEDPQTLNFYAYCHNNPIKYSDPTGHWVWAVLGVAWGAYDGYKYAKKNGLSWQTAAYIAAQVALGIVPVTKLGKFGKLGVKFLNEFKKTKIPNF